MTSKVEKREFVAKLEGVFATSQFVLIAHDKGLKALDVKDLRRKVKSSDGTYMVVKNTLAKIAVDGSSFRELERFLTGPTSVVYSNDPVSVSKAVAQFVKQNDKLEVKAAVMGGVLLDATAVQALSTLPSLDVLRGQLVGLCNAPAVSLIRVLRAPAEQIARLCSLRSKQK
ncbi:50S ribosomal protein L10 [Rickettsiales endosymbiont of Peranema trichophorum]|uniref:50S ribosomal protein L10 n=1 Tax=Rickettsiales endosymbiont of Peranema trichophorum TaxID=2486577 RepID=UPI0013EECCF0|nr:50S ribosomal protein L10 [Rickettsiales endosymbiont of Peranema trichophorum]